MTVYFRRDVPAYLKYFPPFLLLTIVIELIGDKIANQYVNSLLMYDLFVIFEFVFYFFVLYHFFTHRVVKRLIIVAICCYPLLAFADMFWLQGARKFDSYSYSLGALLVIAVCVRYFFELPNAPRILWEILREPSFWVVCALLIFYAATLPVFAGISLVSRFSSRAMKVSANLVMFLNYLLYSLFTVAFLCRPPSPPSKPEYSHRPPVR